MRKYRKAMAVFLVIALLIPKVSGLDDGGTVMYEAVLYSVIRKCTLHEQDKVRGRLEGVIVRILFFEVYNDVRFVPEDKG